MKIAIDARWIFSEISGIGNYTRQLLRQFGELDTLDDQFLLIFNDPELKERTLNETGLATAANFEFDCIPWGVFSPQSQLRLPSYLKRKKVDLFHSPNYMIPLLAFPRRKSSRIKCVTTIHDLIPLIFPDHAPKSRKSRLFPIFRFIMNEVGRRSDAIITVSNASRQDILEKLHIPSVDANKVHTVYNGVSKRFCPPPLASCAMPLVSQPTLLYVGRADPYKNLETLIRALSIIHKTTELQPNLLLAGAPDLRYPEAINLANELGLKDSVKWTGYLSDDDLVKTYQSADLLVHPSRYEGFGLQIIESMACGTPVICSNGGSLPEVAGDAAIQVNPNDADAFAAEIIKVLTHPDIADKMQEDGYEQAQKFRWKKAAEQTLRVYRETVGGNFVSRELVP